MPVSALLGILNLPILLIVRQITYPHFQISLFSTMPTPCFVGAQCDSSCLLVLDSAVTYAVSTLSAIKNSKFCKHGKNFPELMTRFGNDYLESCRVRNSPARGCVFHEALHFGVDRALQERQGGFGYSPSSTSMFSRRLLFKTGSLGPSDSYGSTS